MNQVIKYTPAQLVVVAELDKLVDKIASEEESPEVMRRGELPCYDISNLRNKLRLWLKRKDNNSWVTVEDDHFISFVIPGENEEDKGRHTKCMRAEMDRFLKVMHANKEFVHHAEPEGCEPGTEYMHAKYDVKVLDILKDRMIRIYAAIIRDRLLTASNLL